MKFKRILAAILATAMIISLFACDGGTGSESNGVNDSDHTNSTSATDGIEDSTTNNSSSADETVKDNEATENETETEVEPDMDKLSQGTVILKYGYTQSVINGTVTDTFNKNEAPIRDGGETYISSYFLLEQFNVFADDAVVKFDGVEFLPIITLKEFGFFIFEDVDNELILIAENEPDFASDEEEFAFLRESNNMLAIGDKKIDASIKTNRPVLFTTDEEINNAKAMALQGKEPWASTIASVKSRADAAISEGAQPYTGRSATEYRLAACKDMINAHYMALSYRYTEDTKYLNGAVDFLLAYAKPKLGTDEYLDYSKATTDGQADIGLNIAAPLTTACEVYSLLYTSINSNDKKVIEGWIKDEVELTIKGHQFWIQNDYYDQQYGNNHLTSHLMGIIAGAYVLENNKYLTYALTEKNNPAYFAEMIDRAILMEGDDVWPGDTDSDFRPGEIYDRYRVVSTPSNGFGYSLYHMKFMTNCALMLYNNGYNYFDYIGKNGENLKISYKVYTEYLIQNDATLYGGHYTGNSLNRENAYSMYAMAYYIYGDETIKSVLDAFKAQKISCMENELFGISALYLFGYED